MYLERHAEKDWLIYEEERYTFGEAQEIIDALSAELIGTLGMVKGDVVGLAMRNCPEMLLAFIAIVQSGGRRRRAAELALGRGGAGVRHG